MELQELYLNSLSHNTIIKDINNKSINNSYLIISADENLLKEYVMYFACDILNSENNKTNYEVLVNKVFNNNHADVSVYPLGKALTVEESRKIISDSIIIPYESNFRIYIILNFDKASISAQNALLKVIENSSKYVVFILSSVSEEGVLSTIKSRCNIIREPLLKDEELANIICKTNNIDLLTAKKYVAISSGNYTTAINFIRNKNSLNMLELSIDILKNFINSAQELEYCMKVLEYKNDLNIFFDIFILLLNEIMVINYNNKKEKIIAENYDLYSICNNYKTNSLAKIANVIIKLKEKLISNCNVSMVVDELLFNILEVKYNANKSGRN